MCFELINCNNSLTVAVGSIVTTSFIINSSTFLVCSPSLISLDSDLDTTSLLRYITKIAHNTISPPTINGVLSDIVSPKYPAKNGAIAEPINLKKLYDAEVVGRSTGEFPITAVEVKVLFVPIIAPDKITHTIATH